LREFFGPVSPDRAFPAEREMAEPVSRPHHRRAVTYAGIGNPDTIGRFAELHVTQSRTRAQLLRMRPRNCLIGVARYAARRWRSHGLQKSARADHIELLQPSLRMLILFLGFAPAASNAQ